MSEQDKPEPQLIIAHVCGGEQAERCVDGGEHDMSAVVYWTRGGSVACAKCGVTAMDLEANAFVRDLLKLP